MGQGSVKVGMKPSHPGDFVREEVIDELGLTIKDAAGVLGVRTATLSDLLNEKAALSPEMALRLEMAFGLDMDIMLRMQAWHDAHAMRQRADEINIQPYKLEHP